MASQFSTRKRTLAYYSLSELKRLLLNDKTSILTQRSISDAHSIGFSKTQMVETVQLLRSENFSKSEPAYDGSNLWHDAYNLRVGKLTLYIKLQKSIDKKAIITSFKEK